MEFGLHQLNTRATHRGRIVGLKGLVNMRWAMGEFILTIGATMELVHLYFSMPVMQ